MKSLIFLKKFASPIIIETRLLNQTQITKYINSLSNSFFFSYSFNNFKNITTTFNKISPAFKGKEVNLNTFFTFTKAYSSFKNNNLNVNKLSNLNRNNFQSFGFHLVEQSP